MRARSRSRTPRTRIVLEITPPRRPAPAILERRARALGSRAALVNVIQRSGRLPSLDASLELTARGIEAVWHLTTRGRSRAAIELDLERARAGGIRGVLCLRGDHDARDAPDGLRIRCCVALAREALPAARIGVTLNPYVAGERVYENLFAKLDCGAHFVQTQPIFEAERLRPVARRIRRRAPDVDIVPMVMPLADRAAALAMSRRLRIPIPDGAIGPCAFVATLRALACDPLYAGVALMTPRMDPDRETLEAVRRALGER